MTDYDGVIPFFLTYVLVYAKVSSPSFLCCVQMTYRHFTGLQRSYFDPSFSSDISNGFLGPDKSLLKADALVAHGERLKGRPYPIQATSRDFGPT